MCVVSGPRPGTGGRRLLPGGEADSGWEPGWGRLLLLQAEAGRRPRPWRRQMLRSPSQQPCCLSTPPFHPTLWDSGLTLSGHQCPSGTRPGRPSGGATVPPRGFGLHWVTAPERIVRPPCTLVSTSVHRASLGSCEGWSRPRRVLSTRQPPPHKLSLGFPGWNPHTLPSIQPSTQQLQRMFGALILHSQDTLCLQITR